MGLHYTKLEEMARSAVIHKTGLPSHPNSVFFSTNNEKRKTYAQRNLLKREQSKPEHKAPKHYVEVGIGDSTGIQLPISLSTAAAKVPRRSGSPGVRRWSPEDGGEGLRRVLLLRPLVPPQGANKIYTYDVVFRIGESNTNKSSQTQFPYKKKTAHPFPESEINGGLFGRGGRGGIISPENGKESQSIRP